MYRQDVISITKDVNKIYKKELDSITINNIIKSINTISSDWNITETELRNHLVNECGLSFELAVTLTSDIRIYTVYSIDLYKNNQVILTKVFANKSVFEGVKTDIDECFNNLIHDFNTKLITIFGKDIHKDDVGLYEIIYNKITPLIVF